LVPKGFEEAVRAELREGDRYLLPRASPVYSEEGAVIGVSVILQDVTRLMRFDEFRNDLVATVAHEFRTPLTSLRMAIHLVLEQVTGPVNPKQLDLLHTARQDCDRLQAIVDDLLDVSRMRGGQIEVSPVAIPAKTLIEASVEEMRATAQSAGVRLASTAVEPVLPVSADAERIQIALTNLLANAIRHSPLGGQVEVRAEPRGASVRFEVKDDGPGVPREYRERVFERFFRVPGTKGEGIGLGLYISREIVLAHGGQMGIDSEPGKGSTFWFTLPTAASQPAGVAMPAAK
jgi:signal transduction histidine kinase